MRRIKMKQNKEIEKSKPLIILTAGGTGGHVYPADALAEELSKRGYRVELVTDSRGKNNYKGQLGNIPNHAVLAGGLVGKDGLTKIMNLGKTCLGILQSCILLYRKKPICVVGFGGYASFPCAMASILLGTDLVIHEQNSVMSRTNRFLSKYASLVAQSFPKVKHTPDTAKTILTGMPVRKSIVEIRNQPRPSINEGKFQILILGGSQGAKIFSYILPTAIQKLDKKIQKQLTIYQQCRKEDEDDLKAIYKNSPAKVIVSPFFNNMPELYQQSHLIISRAGASSISEISVVGIPSILIPLPTAADNHQSGNAQFLKQSGGSIVMEQTDFTADNLSNILEEILNHPERLEKMAESTRSQGITNAAELLANAIEQNIINKK